LPFYKDITAGITVVLFFSINGEMNVVYRYTVSLRNQSRVMSAAQFSSQKVISLETYKKNGDPVKSPVWVIEDNGTLYVRTGPESWKAKRMRKNPSVRVAPSTMSGKVKGNWVKGEAHFVEGEDAKRILKLFNKKYGFMIKLLNFYNRLRGRKVVAVISIKV
jgi:PPOX class probable F420-dependent enzyme